MLVGENIGEFSYFDYLEKKTLANGLQIKYGHLIFRKFEGESFGDWPSIRQCFLPPMFSAIRYVHMYIHA